MTTFSDIVARLTGSLLGGDPSDGALRDAKQAVLDAYRDLAVLHSWSYLMRYGVIYTETPLAYTTVSYDPATRTLTNSDSEFPVWAADGSVLIDDVDYLVESATATTITLPASHYHGVAFSDGTPVQLRKGDFLLPADFMVQDYSAVKVGQIGYVHPRELVSSRAKHPSRLGVPRSFTITGHEKYRGREALRIWPYPDTRTEVAFLYKRRPRQLRVHEARLTASVDGFAVSSSGEFSVGWGGETIRFGTAAEYPTDVLGSNPAAFEADFSYLTSTSAAVLSEEAPSPIVGAKCLVSSPLDIDEGSMLSVLIRMAEYQLSISRQLKNHQQIRAEYLMALERARGADSRSMMGRAPGLSMNSTFGGRLTDYPAPDYGG
jgi:hypothetical protein